MENCRYLESADLEEYINQKLNQYLWLFVNERQSNWYNLLLMVEF